MKRQEESKKLGPSPARIAVKSIKQLNKKTKKDKVNPDAIPLTTADLAISTFQYFSEKIEFKGSFRSELWPRHKIVIYLLF